MVSSRGPWRWLRWVIAAVVVIVVLAVGGPFVFFHFIEGNGPARLTPRPRPGRRLAGRPGRGLTVALAGGLTTAPASRPAQLPQLSP